MDIRLIPSKSKTQAKISKISLKLDTKLSNSIIKITVLNRLWNKQKKRRSKKKRRRKKSRRIKNTKRRRGGSNKWPIIRCVLFSSVNRATTQRLWLSMNIYYQKVAFVLLRVIRRINWGFWTSEKDWRWPVNVRYNKVPTEQHLHLWSHG
jgi:hypothetical protein